MKRAGRERSARGGGSRRRFLKLIAASSAGLLAGTASAAPAPARRAKTARAKAGNAKLAPEPSRSKAVEAEIESQKKSLARTLKTIRDYPLPPGSEMAFAFRPIKAARGAKQGAPRSGRAG